MSDKLCLCWGRGAPEHYKVNDEFFTRLTEHTEKKKSLASVEPSAPYIPDTVVRVWQNPHKRVGSNPEVELVGDRSEPRYQN